MGENQKRLLITKGKTNPMPCKNNKETIKATNTYTCGVCGNTVKERLSAQPCEKTSYKRLIPNKRSFKAGR